MENLRGYRVAILANDYFEQPELNEPLKALRDAGADVKVVSTKSGQIKGVHHVDPGEPVKVDATLDQVSANDFDALVLPGGAVNADSLRMNDKAQQFARAIDQSGKPIAVICHGPWLLASAGILKGRRMTSYYTIQDDLKNAGAQWQDSECVVDRNWVSSRKPDDIPKFNQEMIRVFSEHQQKNRKAA